MKPVRSSKALSGALRSRSASRARLRDGDGRLIGIAGDREIALDDRPRLVRQAGAIGCPRQKALGDLAGASTADTRDARDRQDIFDEGLGGLRRLAFDCGEKPGMLGRTLAIRV